MKWFYDLFLFIEKLQKELIKNKIKKLNDYKIKKEIDIKETINSFVEQIPKLMYLLNRFKDECYGNKINK